MLNFCFSSIITLKNLIWQKLFSFYSFPQFGSRFKKVCCTATCHHILLAKKQEFIKRRKLHYNEFQAVKLARQLLESEDNDDEEGEGSANAALGESAMAVDDIRDPGDMDTADQPADSWEPASGENLWFMR